MTETNIPEHESSSDAVFRELRDKLLSMGGLVEKAIDAAAGCLKMDGSSSVKEVFVYENQINAHHIAVDESAVKLLALKHPFATDLRFIVAAIKMNCDLERMGDQAVNIAKNAQRCKESVSLKYETIKELPELVNEVRTVVKDALDSFVSRDPELARKVLRSDDKIDSLKDDIFKFVQEYLKINPESLEQGLNYILIARNLEKIGDHATNIAEDVIFVASGEDIRHRSTWDRMNQNKKEEQKNE